MTPLMVRFRRSDRHLASMVYNSAISTLAVSLTRMAPVVELLTGTVQVGAGGCLEAIIVYSTVR